MGIYSEYPQQTLYSLLERANHRACYGLSILSINRVDRAKTVPPQCIYLDQDGTKSCNSYTKTCKGIYIRSMQLCRKKKQNEYSVNVTDNK